LPYVDSDSSLEFQYKYAILSLVLFKPFRCLEDLVGEGILSDAAWLHAYTEWKETRSDFVKTIMNNMNDYHSGLNHAKAQHAEMKKSNHFAANAHGGADDDSEDGDDDDNLYGVDDEVDSLELEENTDTNDNVVDIWDTDTDSSIVVESNSLNPAVCPSAASPDSRITHILDAFESCRMLQGVARDTAMGATTERCSLPSSIDVRDMKKWISNGNTDNTLMSSQPEQRDMRTTEVVELLDDTLTESNMSWSPGSMVRSQSPPDKVVQFASISAISRAFTLNKKQHCALKKIGIALLTRWKHSEGVKSLSETFCSFHLSGQTLYTETLRLNHGVRRRISRNSSCGVTLKMLFILRSLLGFKRTPKGGAGVMMHDLVYGSLNLSS
jgi:hypothetical protein